MAGTVTSGEDWSWVLGDGGNDEEQQGQAGHGADCGGGDDGQGDHVDGAGARSDRQIARTFVSRTKNVRVAKRDGRRQLSISNWTQNFQNLGVGEISDNCESGINEGHGLWSEFKRQRPNRCLKRGLPGSK